MIFSNINIKSKDDILIFNFNFSKFYISLGKSFLPPNVSGLPKQMTSQEITV